MPLKTGRSLPAVLVASLAFLPGGLVAQTNGTCVPVAERGSRTLGCYITAEQPLGELPRDSALWWHIDAFPAIAAARAARTTRATAVESLGRAWLFTLAERGWRGVGGKPVAVIGPLPLVDAPAFTAVYMEGVFQPGMHSRVHRHPGVEAWYTIEGEQCLETPGGSQVQRAGDPGVMVPGGQPMMLTGTGAGVRRSLVLILQATGQPRSTPAPDWTPRGLCR
jgi:quercetin dioxygenase-like cupin family protein